MRGPGVGRVPRLHRRANARLRTGQCPALRAMCICQGLHAIRTGVGRPRRDCHRFMCSGTMPMRLRRGRPCRLSSFLRRESAASWWARACERTHAMLLIHDGGQLFTGASMASAQDGRRDARHGRVARGAVEAHDDQLDQIAHASSQLQRHRERGSAASRRRHRRAHRVVHGRLSVTRLRRSRGTRSRGQRARGIDRSRHDLVLGIGR